MADPAPRAFARIAGHPALDLVNTVQWRLSPARFGEDLIGYDHVLAWARQFDLVTDEDAATAAALAHTHPVAADEEAARVRDLREAIYAATFEGAEARPVVDEYRDAIGRGALSAEGDQWRWTFPVDLALPRRRMAIEAFDLLTRADLTQLSQCHDADCGWVYLDTSPRHNRRWCVSADCGNRNRVRNYYERTRAAETGQSSGR